MLASGGQINTPLWQRIFWSASTGLVAVALLLSGGLQALQTVTIASALPFSIGLLATIWGLFKALNIDATKKELRHQTPGIVRSNGSSRSWQQRLHTMVNFPRRAHINRFLEEVVTPACNEVADELRRQGYNVDITSGDSRIQLVVQHSPEDIFIYQVRARTYLLPDFINQGGEDEDNTREERKYFRAEVHLREGGQDYDIMGWSRDEVIEDILTQYEQHLHFLHVVRDE